MFDLRNNLDEVKGNERREFFKVHLNELNRPNWA